ncbi:MAG: inner membrane-spanning protein YciB [Pseudomonadota bacterium]
MQTLLEYVPWIVFFAFYKLGGGLYPATAALMVTMSALLAFLWIRARKVPQLPLALTIMVLLFGSATLILHDVRFLQWKASVIYWLLGIVIAGSVWVGSKPLLERMLSGGVPQDVVVPASSWRNASLVTGAFYVLLGFANIWVAMTRSEADWVTFKLWISIPLGMVFLLGVVLYLLRGAFAREPS